MNMNICETGKNKTVIKFKNSGSGNKRNISGNGGNPAVLDQNIFFKKRAIFIHACTADEAFHRLTSLSLIS